MNRLKLLFPTAAAVALLASTCAMAAPRDVPVVVGEEAELDACASWAKVKGLDPKGDGFLAVRGGPGSAYALRDRLHEGDEFFVCHYSRDNQWLAIVYPREGQHPGDCGVSTSLPKPVKYRGPCARGWVHGKWTEFLAG
ncbi:MAG: hypothetical protein ACTHOH_13685 [Lysobacteraceae bacterium]